MSEVTAQMKAAHLKAAQRGASAAIRDLAEMTKRAENAEREVRFLAAENGRLRSRLDIAEARLASFAPPPVARPAMMGGRHG